jgi:hypothetical protein
VPSGSYDRRNHRPSKSSGFEGSPYLDRWVGDSLPDGNYDPGNYRPGRRFQIASRYPRGTSALVALDTTGRLGRPAIASSVYDPGTSALAALDTTRFGPPGPVLAALDAPRVARFGPLDS